MTYSYQKFDFYSYIDSLQRYNFKLRMSNLNKFKDSYQVLEKSLNFCLMRKNKFKDS